MTTPIDVKTNKTSLTPPSTYNSPINPTPPSGIHFTTESGKTSPVLGNNLVESKQMEQCTGLKDWMVNFLKTMPAVPADTLSNAQPHLAVTQHLIWDVTKIDFEKKELTATATYSFRNKVLDDKKSNSKGNDKLVLDVKELKISSITIDGKDVPYEIVKTPEPKNPNKFDALQITIPSDKATGNVVINYTTHPKASGLFWIDPKFTTGKKHPLLYTLFEANEGASVIPGQHSPQIRLSWEVNISTGSPDLIALSSVKNNPTVISENGKYEKLYMDRKIPLYLLCLEVGNMAHTEYLDENQKPTGFGVYSEPVTLDETKEAFKDMPRFIAAAEKIFGPYKWGRYDASVLCNAFPYGAMEHPCKSTFGRVCMGTPEVIAHEITHSWLGNDITNATWYEFFLNEGFTVFGEVLIAAEIWGWDRASLGMLARLSEMEKAINEYRESRPGLLSLVSTDVEFTRIPYGKGALFFFMLRDAIGHEEFGRFVKDYMNVLYQNSISSERFLAFLKSWLENERGIKDFEMFKADNHIDQWLHGLEIPVNKPVFTSKLLDGIKAQAQNVLESKPVDIQTYSTWTEQMKSVFLNELEGKVTGEQLVCLDNQLNFTKSTSLVMRNAWSRVCAFVGHFTPETSEFIISFVLERNSRHLANIISAALCKTPEGRKITEGILRRGQAEDCLFEVTRAVIEQNLEKNSLPS